MDAADKKALANIEEYGCHVLNVMEGEGEPSFTYSIGINKKQSKPDIIILGLKTELAHSIVNNYNDRLLAGEEFEIGKYYDDFLEGFPVCFIKVAKNHYKEYLGWGLWLHGDDHFEMLQMIWPTTDGVFPWDTEKSDFYKWSQPILNETGIIKKV